MIGLSAIFFLDFWNLDDQKQLVLGLLLYQYLEQQTLQKLQ